MLQADLRDRWLGLFGDLDSGSSYSDAFEDLAVHYGESHRAYHNLIHIQHMLSEFDASAERVRDPLAVELAIWFHDVVYDTRAKDNEEKSAQYAEVVLRELGTLAETIEGVSDLILATRHNAEPVDADQRLIVDIDLSILGQAQDRFDAYEKEIRQEYSWVPDAQFRSGRLSILRMFAGRQFLFATEHFRDKYEDAARRNLKRSIRHLT